MSARGRLGACAGAPRSPRLLLVLIASLAFAAGCGLDPAGSGDVGTTPPDAGELTTPGSDGSHASDDGGGDSANSGGGTAGGTVPGASDEAGSSSGGSSAAGPDAATGSTATDAGGTPPPGPGPKPEPDGGERNDDGGKGNGPRR